MGAVPKTGSSVLRHGASRNSLQGPVDQRENTLIVRSERAYAKLDSCAPTIAINLSSESILKHQFAQNDRELAKQYKPAIFTKPNARRAPANSIALQILEKAPKVPVFGSSDSHHVAPHVQTKLVSGNFNPKGIVPTSDVKSFGE